MAGEHQHVEARMERRAARRGRYERMHGKGMLVEDAGSSICTARSRAKLRCAHLDEQLLRHRLEEDHAVLEAAQQLGPPRL